MKLKHILSSLLIGLILVGCSNEPTNDVIKNLVYFSQSSDARVSEMQFIDWNQTEFPLTITPRLAQSINEDVTITVNLDPDYLTWYNQTTGKDYQLFPMADVDMPSQVTIPAGDIAASVKLVLRSVFPEVSDEEEEEEEKEPEPIITYGVPVVISAANGVDVASTTARYMYLVQYNPKPTTRKPLSQWIPSFNHTNAMQCMPFGNDVKWNMELSNYTIEFWCNMSSYGINNQAIINSGGDGLEQELYCRFGDANGPQVTPQYAFFQVKTKQGQFDSGNESLKAGQWYHWALTFECKDGMVGTTTMYKNGVKIGTVSTTTGNMIIHKFQMVSSGSLYFTAHAQLCQVKLWNTTRTPEQVKDDMLYAPTRREMQDLVFYIPMDEGADNLKDGTLADKTGNGHDMKIGSLNEATNKTPAGNWKHYTINPETMTWEPTE